MPGNFRIGTLGGLASDTLLGSSGSDSLAGEDGSDLLQGGADNDTLVGGNGNDTLDGGADVDRLTGGAGADVFKFSQAGDSTEINSAFDRITDFNAAEDRIDLRGLGFNGLDTDGGQTEAGELRLAYSATSNRTYVRTDQSTFEFYLDGDHRTTLTNAQFLFGTSVNAAPVVASPMANQPATEDTAFSFVIPSGTFSDADGDTLSYTAALAGGGALPAWLSFNAVTRTFSGTPLNADVGTLAVRVSVSDGKGGTAFDDFDVVVVNTNDAPTLSIPLVDQVSAVGQAFSYQFASGSFIDIDPGSSVTYAASYRGAALPAWLSFNAATRTFSGTSGVSLIGPVTVTASDGLGGTASDEFILTISAPTTAGYLNGTGAADLMTGTTGADVLLGRGANDTLSGGSGADTLDGGAGVDRLTGGSGADVFKFSHLSDSVITNSGYDRITDFNVAEDIIDLSGLGFTGLDTDGGQTEAGELRLSYSSASNRTYVLSDQTGFDFFLDGNYTATLGNAQFVFTATQVTGTSAGETLTGGTGGEIVSGLAGNDSLNGGAGADTLDGGDGLDTLVGGAGADVFRFSNAAHSLESTMLDRITDFNVAEDRIDLSGLGFTGLDTDGGQTEAGELRLVYTTTGNGEMRTYVRSDQSTFEFFLTGDYLSQLTDTNFVYA